MLAASTLRYLYLAYVARPAHERQIYRAIRRHRVASIVELGVGTGHRAMRLIEVAARYQQSQVDVHYTGIDQFEAWQGRRPSVSLKAAHRMLRRSGAAGQMIPGDPYSALARSANALVATDLLIISSGQDPASLAAAWFYVPRMLHEHSLVLLEEPASQGKPARLRRLTRLEVQRMAAAARPRRAA